MKLTLNTVPPHPGHSRMRYHCSFPGHCTRRACCTTSLDIIHSTSSHGSFHNGVPKRFAYSSPQQRSNRLSAATKRPHQTCPLNTLSPKNGTRSTIHQNHPVTSRDFDSRSHCVLYRGSGVSRRGEGWGGSLLVAVGEFFRGRGWGECLFEEYVRRAPRSICITALLVWNDAV